MTTEWLVLVESNTTGSGRLFCAAARQLGLRPVLLARDPARYPYVAADGVETLVTDTADVAAVLAACARVGGRVAGVTSSSEYFIAIAAEAARALGLPHADPAAVRACRDKSVQRTRLAAAGVPSPAFDAVTSAREAAAAALRLGLPVVVKPVTGSGSVGVQLCASVAEVSDAVDLVLGYGERMRSLPRQGAVLVEAYVAGPEYSVELLHGTPVGVTRKHLGPEPYFVEMGHDFPAPLPAADRDRLERAAAAALAALGLDWGAAHVELRLTATGPVIIEVNPRLAGGMIPQLISEALGVDVVWQLVASAARRPRPPRPRRKAAAAIRFLVSDQPGRLIEVSGISAARAVGGVIDVQLTCEPGTEVRPPLSFSDRLGYVMAAAPTGPAASRAAADGLRALTVLVAGAPVPCAELLSTEQSL
jgi:biotin carboxylase